MQTLKEISKMPPSNYKVIDSKVLKGDLKSWQDRIEILINGKSKFCTRKGAYKFGLAEKAN
jgi:hypothetical protein